MTAATKDRVRLSLDVASSIKSQLEVLQRRTAAGSITEVIRRALALYDLATEHQANGGKIVFTMQGQERETLKIL